jgi:AbrB family looped-hinge helix DNA binding protein
MYARTVKMTGKGQIVVPKEMRDSIGLKRNSMILLIQKDKDIILKKPECLEAVIEDFPEFRVASLEVLKEVWKDEDDKLWESYLKD